MSIMTITNIGAISKASIPDPEGGGVVVLRGRNGIGKSTALDAIQTALTGKGKLPLKDLASKGAVSVAGVTLTLSRNQKRSGELEATILDGKFSVSDLVDPGIADLVRADAARIKALVTLSGEQLEADDLIGFPPEMIEGLNLSDPVAALAELKKRLDIGGREYEKLAASEAEKAKALRSVVGDGPSESVDEQALREQSELALRTLDRLRNSKEVADAAQARAEQARAKLENMPAQDESAHVASEDKEIALIEIGEEEVARLKKALEEEEQGIVAAKHRLAAANAALAHAREINAMRQQLEQQIEESLLPSPTQEEIEAAEIALEKAKAAEIAGVQAKQRAGFAKEARQHEEESERLAEEATGLRRKAKQTEEVLTEIVMSLKNCPLSVQDGRLIIATKRGPTRFDELSHGERWRVSLDIAIAAVGEKGIIVIPQEAWEGLDEMNRAAIATQAKESGVVVVTAECSSDDALTAEII